MSSDQKPTEQGSSSGSNELSKIATEALKFLNTLNDVTFIFVVNELELAEPYTTHNIDPWGNPIPPSRASDYVGEKVGTVWRFDRGVIYPAREYVWSRGAHGQLGIIQYREHKFSAPPFRNFPLEFYNMCTVFDCGPFLPCIYNRKDVTVLDAWDGFWPLKFSNAERVSEITDIGSNRVAGRNACWVGPLVSNIYENGDESAEQSRGLRGDLSIILGMMALAEPPGHTDDAFRSHWRHFRWTSQKPKYKVPDHMRRGVFVYIATESGHGSGRTLEEISAFEQKGIAVFG
ncbi:uncharacterized protein F4822DRAFT_442556 [Hypoxylon trugodes]|uniref:uncharacterized protein n=1 Tax=Hypoxylon trugodes TaxID=326681 RepID=UPI002191176A|nr:uncharacterized protein F4822DRAFT_442556 [Hypoxylon trugodes]KAI1391639.1 hypothetical protein F4822DRAFT_442556 [Hypoxylon trugodes]